MKRRNPPKDLTKAIEAGHQPMFMTGPEIMKNYRVYPGDMHEHESSVDTWNRKLREAKMTGEERYGKDAFIPGRSLMGPDLRAQGIHPHTSLESVAKESGLDKFKNSEGEPNKEPSYISVGTDRTIYGGHHRIALSNEQFKNHIFNVRHFGGLEEAKSQRYYR